MAFGYAPNIALYHVVTDDDAVHEVRSDPAAAFMALLPYEEAREDAGLPGYGEDGAPEFFVERCHCPDPA